MSRLAVAVGLAFAIVLVQFKLEVFLFPSDAVKLKAMLLYVLLSAVLILAWVIEGFTGKDKEE